MDKNTFRSEIEKFLKKHKMAPSTFGVLANKEPNLVFLIREGRECREATQKRILDFIKNYKKQKGKK